MTAGNAPPVNDGAAALVMTSAAPGTWRHAARRAVAQASSGLEPKHVLMTPVEAIRRAFAKTGWKMSEVDLFEINEAFSVQLIAVLRQLGIDSAKVNVNGGAVALGHPIGASGAHSDDAVVCPEAEEAESRNRGALSRGGNGVAVAVERQPVNSSRTGMDRRSVHQPDQTIGGRSCANRPRRTGGFCDCPILTGEISSDIELSSLDFRLARS